MNGDNSLDQLFDLELQAGRASARAGCAPSTEAFYYHCRLNRLKRERELGLEMDAGEHGHHTEQMLAVALDAMFGEGKP